MIEQVTLSWLAYDLTASSAMPLRLDLLAAAAAVRWLEATMRMIKNTAYAWRQMVFFPAPMPPVRVEQFLGWAHDDDDLRQQHPAFQERFRPALQGLVLAAADGYITAEEQRRRVDGPRCFLSCATEGH